MFSFFKRFGRSQQDSKDNAEQKRDDTPPQAPTQPIPAVTDADARHTPSAPAPAAAPPAFTPPPAVPAAPVHPAASVPPIAPVTPTPESISTPVPVATPVPAPAQTFASPPVASPQNTATPVPQVPAPTPAGSVGRDTIAGSAVAPTAPIAPRPTAPAPAPAAAPIPAPAPAVPEPEAFEIVPPPEVEPAAKQSWLQRLRGGLSRTSSNLTTLFVGVKVDEALFEELEDALLLSDAGVEATQFLINGLRQKVRSDRLTEGTQVKAALRDLLVDLLKPLERTITLGREQPMVMMIAGVNGAGKTTSIGKLAKHLQQYGQSVLLAAGDTFRAAAREQLVVWGERNNVTVIEQEGGDPAAVIFDAVNAARARKIDIVMADTAGRLPTQLHLMEELRKVKRVTAKAMDGAPHEVLLVLDANTGQNGLAQVKAFDDALGLTGLIVTKLDGTAKGGILAAIARQRPVPVYFIGVGESVDDLQPFSAIEFADALLG
jgi:fused signal recognition particle receptor